MPVALILALLQTLPAIIPSVAQLVASITAGVDQRGHFTDEQLQQIDQLLTMLNDHAAELEKQRLSQIA